jgi:peroxiredoxin
MSLLPGRAGPALAACVVCLALACPGKSSKPGTARSRQSQPAVPDFTLPDLEGKEHTRSELAGKPAVLDFFQTTCPFCVLELPDLIAEYELYQGRGVQFRLIALNDNPDSLKALRERLGIEFPILLGTHQEAKAFSITSIPVTIVLDAKGAVAYRSSGFQPDSGLKALDRVLARLAPRKG